ncbi:hypothetical protein CDAR_460941 [Caerostris darwini]|uniref:Uncharacterized protein n=1 Tax=Caerostris darwini TaxID=1538125 RepID=A0AAV4R615_9ARAC|nr:hypothetical protein CDAR_460941 [Caerostris darwini]
MAPHDGCPGARIPTPSPAGKWQTDGERIHRQLPIETVSLLLIRRFLIQARSWQEFPHLIVIMVSAHHRYPTLIIDVATSCRMFVIVLILLSSK